MQHDRSDVLRVPRKMTMEVSKVLRLPQKKCNSLSENDAKVLRLPHKTTFDTLRNTSQCHEVPRKTTLQPDLTPSKGTDFAASPHRHGDGRRNPEN